MILPWYARLGLLVIVALALVILYGPLLLTVLLSFFDAGRDGVRWDSFGFHWYAVLFQNRGIAEAVGNTLLVGAATVTCSLVLGTLLAFW